MAQAAGIIEVYGLAAAFVALDAGCKAANVTVETFDKYKPGNADSLPVPLIVCIKFRGGVSDVTAAVEAAVQAGKAEADRRGLYICHKVIARQSEEIEWFAHLSALGKDKLR